MTSAKFKRGIAQALQSIGFEREAKVYVRANEEVVTVLGLQAAHVHQWFINVGFWLRALGDQAHPIAVEQTHMFFRLERLVPGLREDILVAGRLDDPQQQRSYARLIASIPGDVQSALLELETMQGIRHSLELNLSARGLVRKELKEFLRDGNSP